MKAYKMLKHNPFLSRVAAVFLIIPLMLQIVASVVIAESGGFTPVLYARDTEIYNGMEIEAGEHLYARYTFKALLSELEGTEETLILPKGLQAAYVASATTIKATDSSGNKLDVGTLTVGKDKSVTVSFYSNLTENVAAEDENSNETSAESEAESSGDSSGESGNSVPESSDGFSEESAESVPESSDGFSEESRESVPESSDSFSEESVESVPESSDSFSEESVESADEDSGSSGETADVFNFLFMPAFAEVGSPAKTDSDDKVKVDFYVPVVIDTAGLTPNGDGSYMVELESGGSTVGVIVVSDDAQTETHPVATGATTATFAIPVSPYPNITSVVSLSDPKLFKDSGNKNPDGSTIWTLLSNNNNNTVASSDTALMLEYLFTATQGQLAVIKDAIDNNKATYSFEVPEGLILPPPSAIKPPDKPMLIDIGGGTFVQYGTLSVDLNSDRYHAYIKFEGEFWTDNHYQSISMDGGLDVTCMLDASKADLNGKVAITLLTGTTIDLTIPPTVPVATKTGKYNAATDTILWTVTYTEGTGTINFLNGDIIEFKDTFDKTHHEYVDGSFKINGNTITTSTYSGFKDDTVSPNTTLKYEINSTNYNSDVGNAHLSSEIYSGDEIIFTYETRPTAAAYAASGNTTVSNAAKITPKASSGSTATATADATEDIPSTGKKLVSKSGVQSGSSFNDKKIAWTVVIDTKGLLGNGILTVYDAIPAGLALNDATMKVNGTSVATSGITYITDPSTLGAGNVPSGVVTSGLQSDGTGPAIFSFNITGDPAVTKYTITYETEVDEAYFVNNFSPTFNNTAWFTAPPFSSVPLSYRMGLASDSNSGNPIPVGTDIITKASRGYSYDTATNAYYITWEITVNPYKVYVASGAVTDTININTDQLEFVSKDTFFNVIPTLPSNTANGAWDKDRVNISGNTLTVNVDGLESDTFKFQIKTKVLDKNFVTQSTSDTAAGGAVKFDNRAVFVGTGGTTSTNLVPIADTVNAEQRIHSDLFKKTASNYNYDTGKITYTLTVNTAKIYMKNAVVTDNLDQSITSYVVKVTNPDAPSETYTESSEFTVTETPGTINGYAVKKLAIDLKDNCNYKTLEVTIEATVDLTKLSALKHGTAGTSGTDIVYATVVNRQPHLDWSNSGGATPGITNADVSTTIYNKMVLKNNAAYSESRNTITYTVDINPDRYPLQNAWVKDELPKGVLKLDAGSIKLYEATAGASETAPTLTKGTPVNNFRWECDEAANSFTVHMPEPSKSYVLVYECYVVNYRSSITNQVFFYGDNIMAFQSTNNIASFDYDSWNRGAPARNTTASLSILKTDSMFAVPVEGITFQLFVKDSYGNEIKVEEGTTVAGGKLDFRNLSPSTTYFLKEVNDPTSAYIINPDLTTVTMSGNTVTLSQLNRTGFTLSGPTTITVSNQPKLLDIQFHKSSTNASYRLNGAEFTLTASPGNTVYPLALQSTSVGNGADKGTVTFKDVPVGTYTLVETNAPPNYQKPDPTNPKVYTVEVTPKETYTIASPGGTKIYDSDNSAAALADIKNAPNAQMLTNKVDIRFEKVRAGDKAPVDGAVFRLFEDVGSNPLDNTQIELFATSKNGVVVFTDVRVGTYTLTEVSAPANYIKDDTVYTVTVNAEGNYVTTGSSRLYDMDGQTVYDSDPGKKYGSWQVENTYKPPPPIMQRSLPFPGGGPGSGSGPGPTNTPILGPSIPHPHDPGHTLVTFDDGKTYIELDEEGNPIGEWRRERNEDGYFVWTYEEYASKSEDDDKDEDKINDKDTSHPDTGDSSMIFLWILCFYTSAAILIALAWMKRKKNRW